MSMSKEPWTNLHGLIEEVLRAEYRIGDSGIRILLARDWFVRAADLIKKARGESVERAEAVKESLTSALENFIEAYYRGLIGAVPDMPPAFIFLDNPPPSPIVIRNLLEEMVREAESVLRTAEESSVVDSTPTKQPKDSANTEGDCDSVIDEEVK